MKTLENASKNFFEFYTNDHFDTTLWSEDIGFSVFLQAMWN